jgi:uncharacterized membrane protein
VEDETLLECNRTVAGKVPLFLNRMVLVRAVMAGMAPVIETIGVEDTTPAASTISTRKRPATAVLLVVVAREVNPANTLGADKANAQLAAMPTVKSAGPAFLRMWGD